MRRWTRTRRARTTTDFRLLKDRALKPPGCGSLGEEDVLAAEEPPAEGEGGVQGEESMCLWPAEEQAAEPEVDLVSTLGWSKSTLAGWQIQPQQGQLDPEVSQKPYYVQRYKPPRIRKPVEGA